MNTRRDFFSTKMEEETSKRAKEKPKTNEELFLDLTIESSRGLWKKYGSLKFYISDVATKKKLTGKEEEFAKGSYPLSSEVFSELKCMTRKTTVLDLLLTPDLFKKVKESNDRDRRAYGRVLQEHVNGQYPFLLGMVINPLVIRKCQNVTFVINKFSDFRSNGNIVIPT